MPGVRRRDFMAQLGGAAIAWPLAARAQQPAKVHRIAIVSPAVPVAEISGTSDLPDVRAFFKELRRLGYVEGQNLIVELYSAEGHWERVSELAREVVRTKPDLILTVNSGFILKFKAATDTIPIVGLMADPVAYGIVASLARPGGNITGVSVDAGQEIWGKRLQFLREAIPTASRVGYLELARRWVVATGYGAAVQEAARQAGISLLWPGLESPVQETEYRRVLGAMVQEHADGLMVGDEPFNFMHRRLIVDLVEKARLPTIYASRAYFEIGGLMSYGSSFADAFRRLAGYIDQILRGAKPGEIPIYQESKFEFLLNLRTAKALGIEMPTSLLLRADEVIE
jgi:putative ABC transport system substrate-binding protein